MANQIIGRVFQIGDTEAVKSKDGSKTYYKRELIVDVLVSMVWRVSEDMIIIHRSSLAVIIASY